MVNTITSASEIETIEAAHAFALTTLKPTDIVLFSGDLGAGKSVFCRAIIRALSGQPDLDVPSPTFTLVQTYDTPLAPLWHFDLYRLKDPEEIFELGWEDALGHGILLIEWPDRLGPYTPNKYTHITITHDGQQSEQSRRIMIEDINPA